MTNDIKTSFTAAAMMPLCPPLGAFLTEAGVQTPLPPKHTMQTASLEKQLGFPSLFKNTGKKRGVPSPAGVTGEGWEVGTGTTEHRPHEAPGTKST